MIQLPENFKFLAKEKGPMLLLEALKLFGTKEAAGTANNPTILLWADECGISRENYDADSVPWCGLFASIICHRAGKTVPAQPLWARNWLKYGEPCDPELGTILVFERGEKSGHVGLYVGENKENYFVLGGNQGDAVSIVPIAKARLLGARAQYKIRPDNVRKIFVDDLRKPSANES